DNSQAAAFTTSVTAIFANGTTKLDTNSVTMQLDNVAVKPTLTTNGDTTTVTFQPASIFAPNSPHTVNLAYKDTTGASFTKTWSFTVQNYNIIPGSWAVAADKTKPGFIWNMSQVDSVGNYTQDSIARAEAQIAGLIGPNTADPTATGV